MSTGGRAQEALPSLCSRVRSLARTDATVESVKSGLGVDYDHGDGAITVAIDRKNANWFKTKMEEDLLKKVKAPKTEKSLVEMLEAGIQVADVGCGLGASTILMATRFPKSHFSAFSCSCFGCFDQLIYSINTVVVKGYYTS